MHARRLEARRRIGQLAAPRQSIIVLLPRVKAFEDAAMVAAAFGLQIKKSVSGSHDVESQLVKICGPHQEPPATAGKRSGTKRHLFNPVLWADLHFLRYLRPHGASGLGT